MFSHIDKNTMQVVNNEVTAFARGLVVTTEACYSYDEPYGAPLSPGKTWSYTQTSMPSFGPVMTDVWTVEVVGTEEITVPAGTFDRYKVVSTNDPGSPRSEWWPINDEYPFFVKMVYGNNIKTHEPMSCTEDINDFP